MKKIALFSLITAALCFHTAIVSGQRRPVRKPATATAPTQTVAKSTPKAASSAEEFFSLGLKCDAKDYDCQVSNYTKAINLQLNTKAVYQNRAVAYMGREDFEKAIADLTKVIELDPNDANGFKDRGKAYLLMARNSQNLQFAARDFMSAIDLEPKDADAYNLRGKAHHRLGDFVKATADFEKALILNPDNADAIANRGYVLLTRKEFDGALEAFNQSISIQPNYSGYFGRGSVYLKLKKFEEAIIELKKATEFPDRKAEVFALLAELFQRKEDAPQAIEFYSKAISSEPKANYFYARGKLYQGEKQGDRALKDLSEAINTSNAFAKAYEARGLVYFEQKEYDKAIDDLNRAISLDPSLYEAYSLRGTARMVKFGSSNEEVQADWLKGASNAIPYLTRELALDPDAYEKYYARAANYDSIGDFERSSQDYKRAIDLDPKPSVDAFLYLANSYASMKRNDQAVEALTSGLDANPNSASLYWRRAAILQYGLNSKADAAMDYRRAAELLPEGDKLKKSSLDMATALESEVGYEKVQAAKAQKEIRDAKRKENAVKILGALTEAVVGITNSRQAQSTNSGQQATTTQSTANRSSTSNPSSSTGGHKYINRPVIERDLARWNEQSFTDCATDTLYKNMPQYRHCWSPWTSLSGNLSGVQVRGLGPIGDSFNAINDEPNKRSYSWWFGFKNTSSSIIYVSGDFVLGSEKIGVTALLGPGQFYKFIDAANHTFSNPASWTFAPKEYEICTNVTRVTYAGEPAWQCNEK